MIYHDITHHMSNYDRHMNYHGVGPIHRFLLPAVQVHNPPCNGIVCYLGYNHTAHHGSQV